MNDARYSELLDALLGLREATEASFNDVYRRFGKVDARFDGIDRRFDGIDRRLDGIDRRLDGLDRRFLSLESRMEGGFAETLGAISELRVSLNRAGLL